MNWRPPNDMQAQLRINPEQSIFLIKFLNPTNLNYMQAGGTEQCSLTLEVEGFHDLYERMKKNGANVSEIEDNGDCGLNFYAYDTCLKIDVELRAPFLGPREYGFTHKCHAFQRHLKPVSSAASRRAASQSGSPGSEVPFGRLHLPETLTRRISSPRRMTTPAARNEQSSARRPVRTGNHHGIAIRIPQPTLPMVGSTVTRWWIAMSRKNDFNIHLSRTSDGSIKVVDFKPQQHPVAVGLVIGIPDWTVVMFGVKAMQLKYQCPIRNKPLILRATVIALAPQQFLVPPATCFYITHHDHWLRTYTHGGTSNLKGGRDPPNTKCPTRWNSLPRTTPPSRSVRPLRWHGITMTDRFEKVDRRKLRRL